VAADPLIVARALEERLRDLPGIAGLDPSSRLATRTGDGRVRGIWVRPEGSDTITLELELVGLLGSSLPEAAQAARATCALTSAEHGWATGRIEVSVTDLADERLPLQGETRSVARAAQPLGEGVQAPAPTPVSRSVCVPVDGGAQRAVLRITVEVLEDGE